MLFHCRVMPSSILDIYISNFCECNGDRVGSGRNPELQEKKAGKGRNGETAQNGSHRISMGGIFR